ncbi:UDP-N-acetylglucosamine-dolichyl-phosphate N-acetylglucosaminephosphotransferase [Tremella mesenterica]|uniref:UDP-N-acetylglucosamine--dolichyl-phosphate N-acetylglucosaminephosphotransferase n=1 Tax=Tremella mesenterica TaxID=5217 RepID=A0A4Q1BLZ8_TREME|nr:UDP-N-acetylglucosamine-dolichyl-phosphate N-acetylglucosaminephosphotransferase [Tremella mesenterica]
MAPMSRTKSKDGQEQYGRPLPKLFLLTVTPIAFTLIIRPFLPILLHSSLLTYLPLPGKVLDKLRSVVQPSFPALQANVGFSLLAFVGSVVLVPQVGKAFVEKGLKGRDLCKPGGRISGPYIPECLGLPCASLYILLMMLFIPFPFSHLFTPSSDSGVAFSQQELTLYLSSLLSLLTATLLGFIDDLFDIRWRHKLPIPLVASVPTLLVYYSEGGWTSVVLPSTVGNWLSSIGPLYYIYLLLLPTFTTNSINIVAGINGVEVTQALIIALSVLLNDLLFIPIWPERFLAVVGGGNPSEGRLLGWAAGEVVQRHLMSAYFMAPMVGVCAGFLWHNWYPAKAFPGDTFCYFTGMAFSVVAIHGHFSKTLILFFIPQIFNFILSCPQLFHLVPCPRHRLPRYDATTNLLFPSLTEFERPPEMKTRVVLRIMEVLRLVKLERASSTMSVTQKVRNKSGNQVAVKVKTSGENSDPDNIRDGGKESGSDGEGVILSSTNLTILNLLLVHFGPMREQSLCLLLGFIQVFCSGVAFGIRYGLGSMVYGGERR